MNHQDTGEYDEEFDDAYDGPSKSQRKREMTALQDLGGELVRLSADQLAKLPLPDDLLAAVRDHQRFKKNEARRRQLQYIGKLMRNIDPAPIQAGLDALKGVSADEVARQHRIERQRDRLMEDEGVLFEIAEANPGADLQRLRVLRRNALKERETNKPPRSYREIFRVLREIDESNSSDE
jgi:ribosome-associated protein